VASYCPSHKEILLQLLLLLLIRLLLLLLLLLLVLVSVYGLAKDSAAAAM
jgi:hypothetical protein